MNVSEQIILLMNYLMQQQEAISKMQYHFRRYEYYKWIIADGKYKMIVETRENENEVIKRISEQFWVHIDEIKSPRRYKPLSEARSEIVKELKDNFWLTYERISKILWMKDHSSCIYLYNKKYDNYKNNENISWTGN